MVLGLKQWLNRLSLPTVLTVPFLLQGIGVAGVVGYLSFKNGEETARTLAAQLRQELTARILQQLEDTIERPYLINQINAHALRQGDLNLTTGKGADKLWQQARVFPAINLIYCATEDDGAFLGMGPSQGGIGEGLQYQIANPRTQRNLHYYDVDVSGNPTFLLSKGNKPYDPRLRPWYKIAKEKGQSSWSEVYIDFDAHVPVITANTPVYSPRNGQLLGVCATDIILAKELAAFLRSLQISPRGVAFIMEPSGLLIASSLPETMPVQKNPEDLNLKFAKDDSNPLVQEAARYLGQHFGALDRIQTSQLDFMSGGDRLYLEVRRFKDPYNLDWIVVLVMPEDDFMGQINDNTKITLLLCLVALLLALLLGILISQWLTRPLLVLSVTAKEIARGEWDRPVPVDRADVIGDLSRSFAAMVAQLKTAFHTLEERIEDRTQELQRANAKLARLAHTDSLTQTANRRYFDQWLEQQWQRLAAQRLPLSLILCDVDYFKRFNDTYGHQAGDACLQQVAQVLLEVLPAGQMVARYGGEEFAIVLAHTSPAGAIALAQQVIHILEAIAVPHETSEKGRVSLSLGIATTIPKTLYPPQSLIVAADLALYQAKAQGRDRYEVATVAMLREGEQQAQAIIRRTAAPEDARPSG